jgi:hypothetical protein
VIDGTMTLAEARARVGREKARRRKPEAAGGAVKSAGAPPRWTMEHHSDPQIREGARDAMVAKSRQGTPGSTPAPARPAGYWGPVQLALLRQSVEHPDPAERENARKALVEEGLLP